MAISHDELIEFIIEELERMNDMLKCMPKSCKHLDQDDDDYVFIDENLERCGEERVPRDYFPSTHQRLEMEADAILAGAQ